jgi:hypothetical protein
LGWDHWFRFFKNIFSRQTPKFDYWSVLEPYWNLVDIHDSAEVFQSGFSSLPQPIQNLFAAHWAVYEIKNGALTQFYFNSTGVLAPEAVTALKALGLSISADALENSMVEFGIPYPREYDLRAELTGNMFNKHRSPETEALIDRLLERTDQFLDGLGPRCRNFEIQANAYAKANVPGVWLRNQEDRRETTTFNWIIHMKTLLFVTTLLINTTLCAEPSCSKVSEVLFGVRLGPIQNYPDGLRHGIVREGTAEVIADVGFESLQGKAESIVYPRIMAFFDRGNFTSVAAFGSIRRDRDHGYAQILERVAATANTTYTTGPTGVVFACEPGIELTAKPMSWEGKPIINVRVGDTGALQRTKDYIDVYCADPSKRRPQDACKK